jgi:hypothetical protein
MPWRHVVKLHTSKAQHFPELCDKLHVLATLTLGIKLPLPFEQETVDLRTVLGTANKRKIPGSAWN